MKKNKLFPGMLAALALSLLMGCPDTSGGGDSGPGPGDQKAVTVSGESFNLRYVPATPAGGFQRRGTPNNKTVLSQGYWMAETEVTQELFDAVMGTNPSNFSSGPASGETQAKRPVEQVSWYDAIAFCNKLSLLNGKTPVYSVKVSGVEVAWATLAYASIPSGASNADWDAATVSAGATGYRLPTEMQWMWAAMGATKGGATVASDGYGKGYAGSAEGSGQTDVGNYAWYDSNASSTTHETGKKTANELGLYDMSGNVWEWCWDWDAAYDAGTLTDPTGAASGTNRVVRGCSWYSTASSCSVATRSGYFPNVQYYGLGFRFVCP
jgi:formylglycine-generating enzyme required for sulfatase activity